ncbi:phosphoribosylaminoimidazole carboxylase [Tenacibaculum sp. S7007]|uniref:Phosphoribosylaminoimidazole carboxylase n=1 Tax=Tenacibaculum pelagium TaxID=2759527 RepID=A0A839APT0_9FLAO|nr:phosphoribosylaminoimidazole carboxylase [Tenacibaculum pelagium]MBA6155721.1 phosphoribosylaminoimidazole carboxylase [Tenacibaculum pelagium]
MKKVFLLIIILISFSCSDNTLVNNCFSNLSFDELVDLSNPEFNAILTPGNHVITNEGGRNILIIHRGTTPKYKAFDLQCPERNCNSPMTFDGLFLKCSCDDVRYNSLSGCPVNNEGQCKNDNTCFALEYTVREISQTSLQITR